MKLKKMKDVCLMNGPCLLTRFKKGDRRPKAMLTTTGDCARPNLRNFCEAVVDGIDFVTFGNNSS